MYPSSALSRTCSSNARKLPPASTRTRNASVFTNNPITPSVSTRFRFATGVPTTKSFCPVYRYSNAANPPSNVMNSVTPSPRLNRLNPAACSSPIHLTTDPPRGPASLPRAPSAGSSTTPLYPLNCSFQYSISPSSTPPLSHSRCHIAQSVYCTGNSFNSASLPSHLASYSWLNSRVSIPVDHPSATMWCRLIPTTWSCPSISHNLTRSNGPRAKSNLSRTKSSSSFCSSSSLPTRLIPSLISLASSTTCTGSPSISSKCVRNDPCRSTSFWKLCSRASTFSSPFSLTAAGM